ncbi:hypothetical protein DYY67_0757 [Candidatus Nitrosotalea sp. TS]|nr:hypothetical protein [Candidatus Nitrosotalea sp. TS]
MIADDSDAIRMVLKDILIIGKHEFVAEASNGLETFEQFKKTNPDIVLLDVAMPKKDGLTVLKEIITHTDQMPKVIMITASDNQVTMRECIRIGASSIYPQAI